MPVAVAPVMTQPAEQAYELILKSVGAVLPKQDPVDSRIIEEVRAGIATYGGIWGHRSGIIDSQQQVGGWPELKTGYIPNDTDHDGMPDDWEITYGLDPVNPIDRNGDADGDGHTNLENYLNSLVLI